MMINNNKTIVTIIVTITFHPGYESISLSSLDHIFKARKGRVKVSAINHEKH